MADPDHVPELDPFDRTTVTLYRTGLAGSALSLGAVAALLEAGVPAWPAWVAVLTFATLSVTNLHLYDKRIRWIIVSANALGACLMVVAGWLDGSAAHWVHHAGAGFVFVALSGLALKEQFCFKVPFLRAVPLVLAISLLPLVLGADRIGAALLFVGAVLIGVLAGAKVRMPLHFDVGDKSNYQV